MWSWEVPRVPLISQTTSPVKIHAPSKPIYISFFHHLCPLHLWYKTSLGTQLKNFTRKLYWVVEVTELKFRDASSCDRPAHRSHHISKERDELADQGLVGPCYRFQIQVLCWVFEGFFSLPVWIILCCLNITFLLSICQLMDFGVQPVWNYFEECNFEHLFSGLCVDMSFHVSWVNIWKCNYWVLC